MDARKTRHKSGRSILAGLLGKNADAICSAYQDGKPISQLAEDYRTTYYMIRTLLVSKGIKIKHWPRVKPFPLCKCGCDLPVSDRRASHKRGHGPHQPFLGYKHSPETKKVISHKVTDRLADGHHYQRRFQYGGPKGDILMRSAWEVEIAEWLDYLDLDWKYEAKSFETSLGLYTPDFYLPLFDVYVEVKGYWYEDAIRKVRAFEDENPEITLFICRDAGPFGKLYLSQRLLEKGYGHDVTKMDDAERIEYFRDQMLMLYNELAEIMQEFPWKAHKTYTTNTVNRKKFLEEWVDGFVFLINSLAALNADEQEVIESIGSVEIKNFLRQQKGYVGLPGEDLKGTLG